MTFVGDKEISWVPALVIVAETDPDSYREECAVDCCSVKHGPSLFGIIGDVQDDSCTEK